VLGTLAKSAPAGGYFPPITWNNTYPPLPWLFEYAYMDDCIKVRAVKPQPILIPNFSPQPHLFTVTNDGNERVILSNVKDAVVTYTGQVTDPTDMSPDFIEAFVASLARRFSALLANLDVEKIEGQDEMAETALAERTQQG
jgi:hypothetical protein